MYNNEKKYCTPFGKMDYISNMDFKYRLEKDDIIAKYMVKKGQCRVLTTWSIDHLHQHWKIRLL